MAEIITSQYGSFPVVTAFVNNKMEYLSVVRKNELDNIYVCKVDHIVKNLNSAFVRYSGDEIGYVQLRSIDKAVVVNRSFSDSDSLRQGDEVILQLDTEDIKTKKPSLTGHLTVTGKFCVITLGRNGVGASKKLSDEKRSELISKVKSHYKELQDDFGKRLYDGSFGIIIRTQAALLDQEDYLNILLEDIKNCLDKLCSILKDGRNRTIYSVLFENSSGDIDAHIEKAIGFLRAKEIFEYSLIKDSGIHGITGEIDKLLKNRIWLKSGAYIVIEQLESFNAIDVNTGKAIKGKKDISEEVNIEACDEIVRQIRLRNLTGMILIDFINMHSEESDRRLIGHIKNLLRTEPVHTSFIDITGLGIMELTRNKNDKSLKEILE